MSRHNIDDLAQLYQECGFKDGYKAGYKAAMQDFLEDGHQRSCSLERSVHAINDTLHRMNNLKQRCDNIRQLAHPLQRITSKANKYAETEKHTKQQ